MNRLSERFSYYCGLLSVFINDRNVKVDDFEHIQNLICAEEQGLLLKLPCKIGDAVYAITRDFISKYTIRNIEIYNEGFFFCWECEKGIYINVRGFTNYQIGIDVFLTQEQAEEALKKRLN